MSLSGNEQGVTLMMDGETITYNRNKQTPKLSFHIISWKD